MKSQLAGYVKLISVACIILLSISSGAAEELNPFQPRWHSGLSWHVQVVYASLDGQQTWSQPVVWEYQISDIENSSSEDNFIHIDARSPGGTGSKARFFYRTDDLSLVRADIINVVRGREKINTSTFDGGHPVVTRYTPIPFDSPVFPITPSLTTNYQVTAKIANSFKKRTIIEQAVTVVPGGSAPLPEWTAGKQLFKIECRDKTDGALLFVQYWEKDFPWPVYGENENMKYWIEDK